VNYGMAMYEIPNRSTALIKIHKRSVWTSHTTVKTCGCMGQQPPKIIISFTALRKLNENNCKISCGFSKDCKRRPIRKFLKAHMGFIGFQNGVHMLLVGA
jgi:hypothetical protein